MARFFVWFFALLLLLGSGALWFGISTGRVILRPEGGPLTEVPSHRLMGAWEATDRTVFIFRADGTFIGTDLRKKEIWGNWVRLDEKRIGFQTLRHGGYYLPQFAVVRDADTMDFVIGNGTRLIEARRVAQSRAESVIAAAREAEMVSPEQPEAPSP